MTDPQNNTPSPPGNVDPNIKSPENPLRSKTAVRLALLYDIVMLLVIVIDLSIISLDLLLMSKFMGQVADWLNLSQVQRLSPQHHGAALQPGLKN